MWSITHDPALNIRATITRPAAGGERRNICTSIYASIAALVNTGIYKVYLRDGASDVGPIIWSAVIRGVNTTGIINLTNLHITGSENTPMTLEFDTSPGVNNQQNVSLTGSTI